MLTLTALSGTRQNAFANVRANLVTSRRIQSDIIGLHGNIRPISVAAKKLVDPTQALAGLFAYSS